MNPFAVIIYPDGRPVQPEEVHRMLDPISYAGPGGRSVWVNGCFGVGCLFSSEPARSTGAKQPLISPCGRYLLVADGRLHQRESLIRSLGKPRDAQDRDDTSLLFAAWKRWREEAGRWLYGDYAFVVIDRLRRIVTGITDFPGNRRLFCARGRTGALLVSSEEACILSDQGIPTQGWNEIALAHWLMGCPRRNRSIFQAITVAACGEVLYLDSARIETRKWWTPKTSREYAKATLDMYAEEYRHLLTTVVRDRLDGRSSVVCELSGGMDSSTVTAAAKMLAADGSLHITTVTHVYPEFPSSNDAKVAAAIRESLGIEDAVLIDGFATLQKSLGQELGPRSESPGALSDPLHDAALQVSSRTGAKIILVGLGGDEVLRGQLVLSVLSRLSRGEINAFTELVETAKRRNEPITSVVVRQFLRPLVNLIVGDNFRSALKRKLGRREKITEWIVRDQNGERRIQKDRHEAAASLGTARRLRNVAHELHFTPSWFGLDAFRLNAAPAGVTVQAPLLDRRVVEFAISTPADIWFRSGLTKYLPRFAFAEMLPSCATLAARKTMVTEPMAALWHDCYPAVHVVAADAARVCTHTPLRWVTDALCAYLSGPPRETLPEWFGYFLAIWLNRYYRSSVFAENEHR